MSEVGFQIMLVTGNYHYILRIVPDDQKRWANDPNFKNNTLDDGRHFMTISGGYDGSSVPGFWGNVESGINWGNDVKTAKTSDVSFGVVHPDVKSGKLSENDVIANLIKAEKNFEAHKAAGDTLPYKPVPSDMGGYNSNSVQSGILESVGFGKLPDPPKPGPGWEKPIPSKYFQCKPSKDKPC